MAWTQSDIDRLDEAYRTGAQQTTASDGRHVTWRSVDEYVQLRNLMKSEVSPSSAVDRTSYASFSKE